MTFANRLDAGRQLGASLLARPPANPVVVGISRGGVPVAAELAHVLGAPLEICVVRKLFSPGSPAYSIGAVAENDAVYLDAAEIEKLGVSPTYIENVIALESAEVTRLAELLRDRPPLSLDWRDVILVDDGITCIDTLHAAALSVRNQRPATLTLAVPAASSELLERVRPKFDRVVCLLAEESMSALGTRYRDFWPVSETEVAAALADAHRLSDAWAAGAPAGRLRIV